MSWKTCSPSLCWVGKWGTWGLLSAHSTLSASGNATTLWIILQLQGLMMIYTSEPRLAYWVVGPNTIGGEPVTQIRDGLNQTPPKADEYVRGSRSYWTKSGHLGGMRAIEKNGWISFYKVTNTVPFLCIRYLFPSGETSEKNLSI